MIRIQLLPRRRRLVPLLFLFLGVFLAGALGLFFLARDEKPPLPPELAALHQPSPPADPGPEEKTPPAPPKEIPPPAQEEVKAPAEEARPPARGEPQVAAAPPPAKAQVPVSVLPPTGPLCLRILKLHERLPPGVRCTSLSGAAGGEYTIEGTVSSADFPQLIALLDGLQRLPSRATLSSWRAGKKEEGEFNFNLHGQFAAESPARLAPLATSEAQGLFTQAAALARKSRLDSVRVGAPLFTPLGKGVVQQRQKLWATGSYQQLRGFLETLVRQKPQLGLEEVMLVPLYKGETQWKRAQIYAVLSAPVRAAR